MVYSFVSEISNFSEQFLCCMWGFTIFFFIFKKVPIWIHTFWMMRKVRNNLLSTMLSLQLKAWHSCLPSWMSASCTASTSCWGVLFPINAFLPLEVVCIEGEKSHEIEALEKITYAQETHFSLSVWTGLFSIPTSFFITVTHPLGHLCLRSQGTGEHLLFVLLPPS